MASANVSSKEVAIRLPSAPLAVRCAHMVWGTFCQPRTCSTAGNYHQRGVKEAVRVVCVSNQDRLVMILIRVIFAPAWLEART